MKLAFMFNYPLADNVQWKKVIVQEFLNKGFEVDVYYGKTFPIEYIQAYLIKRKFSSTSSVSNRLRKKTKKNTKFFKELGVSIFKIKL